MQIGRVRKAGDDFFGWLDIHVLDVPPWIIPALPRMHETAPNWRFHLDVRDGPDIGWGWTHERPGGRTTVALGLDCPTFAQPIHADLIAPGRHRDVHRPIWLRRRTIRRIYRLTVRFGAAGLAFILIGTTAISAVPDALLARAQAPAVIEGARPYATFVADAAQHFGINVAWIEAMIRIESGGNPRAISAAGAMGLMQLMPTTWAMMRTRYGLGADPFEPHANILAGTAYLRDMLDRYGDRATALAAYNAGPGRADDWVARRRSLPPETVAYVAGIARLLSTSGAPVVTVTQDWRAAALFASRQSAASTALHGTPPAPSTVQPVADLTAMPGADRTYVHRDQPVAEPRNARLFVALSGPSS